MNDLHDLADASHERPPLRSRRGRRTHRGGRGSAGNAISSSVWIAFTLAVALAFVVGWFGGREFLYFQIRRDVDRAMAMVDQQMAQATRDMQRMFDPATPEGRKFQRDVEQMAKDIRRALEAASDY